MNPLYTVAEIRAIERAAAAALPPGALMQRAGQASANAALDLMPFSTAKARVLVLAGPGDNGGDALEAAAHLSFTGAQVTLIHFAPGGTPRDIVQRLNAEVGKALDAPDLKKRFDDMGLVAKPSTPEEFGRFLFAEMARWKGVLGAKKP